MNARNKPLDIDESDIDITNSSDGEKIHQTSAEINGDINDIISGDTKGNNNAGIYQEEDEIDLDKGDTFSVRLNLSEGLSDKIGDQGYYTEGKLGLNGKSLGRQLEIHNGGIVIIEARITGIQNALNKKNNSEADLEEYLVEIDDNIIDYGFIKADHILFSVFKGRKSKIQMTLSNFVVYDNDRKDSLAGGTSYEGGSIVEDEKGGFYIDIKYWNDVQAEANFGAYVTQEIANDKNGSLGDHDEYYTTRLNELSMARFEIPRFSVVTGNQELENEDVIRQKSKKFKTTYSGNKLREITKRPKKLKLFEVLTCNPKHQIKLSKEVERSLKEKKSFIKSTLKFLGVLGLGVLLPEGYQKAESYFESLPASYTLEKLTLQRGGMNKLPENIVINSEVKTGTFTIEDSNGLGPAIRRYFQSKGINIDDNVIWAYMKTLGEELKLTKMGDIYTFEYTLMPGGRVNIKDGMGKNT